MTLIATTLSTALLDEGRCLFKDHPYEGVLDDLSSDLAAGRVPDATFASRSDDGALTGFAVTHAPLAEGAPWSTQILTDGPVSEREALLDAIVPTIRRGVDVEWWDRGPSIDLTGSIARNRRFTTGRRIEVMERTDTSTRAATDTRPFVIGDAQRVADINNAAFIGHADRASWTATTVEQELSLVGPPSDLLLAPPLAQPLGFVWTKRVSEGVGEIYVIATHPDGRGTGLGTALLEAGIQHMVETYAVTTVVLYVDADNFRAIKLYEHHGFVNGNKPLVSFRFRT